MPRVAPTYEALADDLSRVIITLQQRVVRAARESEHLTPLPDAQAEILGLLLARGPLTPADIVRETRFAGPTVSNQITALVHSSLAVRERSSTDGRSVLVRATDEAHRVIDAFQRGRIGIMADAIASLPDAEQRWLLGSVDALRSLLDAVENRQDLRATQPG